MPSLNMARYGALMIVIFMMVSSLPIIACTAGDPGVDSNPEGVEADVETYEELFTSQVTATFDHPTFELKDGRTHVEIGGLNQLLSPVRPNVPYHTMKLEFGTDFRLVDVDVDPGHVIEYTLDKPIEMNPDA